MKEFLAKYQYLLPFTAGAMLGGISLYYLVFDTSKMELGAVLMLGALLNIYLGFKMRPRNQG